MSTKLSIRYNPWVYSARNVGFDPKTNMLKAELRRNNGSWHFNFMEIHPLLRNKPLVNQNGLFRYNISPEEAQKVHHLLFPIYHGLTIPSIDIKKCIMISVNTEKYNKSRNETISILKQFKLPPIITHFGYTRDTGKNSRFNRFVPNKKQSFFITVALLEIFENFVKESVGNEWFLFFEDDVRPVNLDSEQDLTKLFNVPVDAELIRPYIGKNEPCDLNTVEYHTSYGGGLNHAIYLSTNACRKLVNYARKYTWKHVGDIDLYKLAKHCGRFPTGLDGWTLHSVGGNNQITPKLQEDEKITMYHLSHIIFNQTSNPVC
jgi:hypothetical protein